MNELDFLEARLRLLITDLAPGIRQSILVSLQDFIEREEVRGAIDQCLRQDSCEQIKLQAAVLLIRLSEVPSETLKTVLELCKKLDDANKRFLIISLEIMPPSAEVLATLIDLLENDPSIAIRREAAHVICNRYLMNQNARDALLKAAQRDSSGEVRWLCYRILDEIWNELDFNNSISKFIWIELYNEIQQMLIEEDKMRHLVL